MDHVCEIVVEGASNVRDLGWTLRQQGERPVGPARIIRSANLDRLTPAGQRRIGELGIAFVIDLRGIAEAAAAPIFADVTRIHLPIEPTVVADLTALLDAGKLDAAAAVGVMEKTYRHYVREHASVFAEVLHRTIAAAGRPLLFHCAAGKDRTGVAAALILTALGVEREALMVDYLLSNQLYRPLAPSTAPLPDDVRAAILKVRPSFLDAAFTAMEEDWGGADNYLERALGIGARERTALAAALA